MHVQWQNPQGQTVGKKTTYKVILVFRQTKVIFVFLQTEDYWDNIYTRKI